MVQFDLDYYRDVNEMGRRARTPGVCNIVGIIATHNNSKAVRLIYRHHSAFSTHKDKMVQNSKEDYQLAQKVTQLLSFLQEALRSEAAAYVQPKTSNDEAH